MNGSQSTPVPVRSLHEFIFRYVNLDSAPAAGLDSEALAASASFTISPNHAASAAAMLRARAQPEESMAFRL